MDPSPHESALDRAGTFFVGRDAQRCWIVREATGRCAGIFTSRETALRFARDQGDGRLSKIVFTSQIKLFDDAR